MRSAPPRVAVTGLGLMSGLGLDLDSSWAGLLQGRCPVGRFRGFDPAGLDCDFGVELPAGAEERFRWIKPRQRRQMTRGTRLAVTVARMAAEDSGFEQGVDRSRVGVVLGSTGTGYAHQGPERDEHRILRNMSNAPAAWISIQRKYTGPCFVVGTACSAGIYALASAFELIQSGQCDAVLAGACDSSINALDVGGFESLMALAHWSGDPAQASRPFDRQRAGFVMGEGGGVLVLESLQHARRRDARIYAQLSRPALTTEAFNILSPQRAGVGMAVTMRRSLELAGLEPARIDYVNAHGTSTLLNDRNEVLAIRSVFGDHAGQLAVSSTKSMTGHCLAAAAGVEAVICCLALHHGAIPPTANLGEPDPELQLDFVPLRARRQALRHVMCNAFAFGGHNGVCIFSGPGEQA